MRAIAAFMFLISAFTLGCSGSSGGSGSTGLGPGDGRHKGERPLTWQMEALGQEGHGGDAVVCFNVPVERALYKVEFGESEKCKPGEQCQIVVRPDPPGGSHPSAGVMWRMTVEGRSSIRSAKPLEQYLAERTAEKKSLIDQLNRMSTEEGYRKIIRAFENLPAPGKRIMQQHRRLGWLHQDGISSEYGLMDINDSGFLGEHEIDHAYCKELQAVVRRDSQLWYDADILSHFDNAGRVLIQLHEEIYAWGKQQDEINSKARGHSSAHGNSIKTRRLILKLLNDGVDTQLVNESLKELGFSTLYWDDTFNMPTAAGYYMDSQSCVAEQKFLRNYLDKIGGPPIDFYIGASRLVSSRYLKSLGGQPEEQLRHNYPDGLSNMIALILTSGDPDGDFIRNVMELLKEFEKPESCEGYSSDP